MLKEIQKSFSCSKKKRVKPVIVNEWLSKQLNIPQQGNELKPIESKNYTNSTTHPKQIATKLKINECDSLISKPMINNNTQTKSLTKYKTKANTSAIKDIDIKEDYLLNRDDKTIDSTLPNKLHRNSSHGTFSINKLNISGSFHKPLKSNKKVNSKLINDYLFSISKDFWNKDIQQQKEEFYQNYENNSND